MELLLFIGIMIAFISLLIVILSLVNDEKSAVPFIIAYIITYNQQWVSFIAFVMLPYQ